MKTKGQHRGHCQICGHIQVVESDGRMAQHGYKVAGYGYFQGVCPGSTTAPLERSRIETDQLIARLRAQAQRADVRSVALRGGNLRPEFVKALHPWGAVVMTKNADGTRVEQLRTWREGSPAERTAQVDYEASNQESSARSARAYAADLSNLADRVFGTKLIDRDQEDMGKVAERKAKSAPIAGAYRTKAEQKRELENLSRAYDTKRRQMQDRYLSIPNADRNSAQTDLYNALPFELHNWRSKHSLAVLELYPEMSKTVNDIEVLQINREEIKSRPVIK